MKTILIKIKLSFLFLGSVVVLLSACNSKKYNISSKPIKFLEEVLGLLKEHSVNKNKIDWKHLIMMYLNLQKTAK